MAGRAIFLDRDGVVNAAVVRDGRPYPPASVDELVIPPGTRGALERLKAAGFALYGCTNQPDVARGTTPRSAVEAINARLMAQLPLDGISVCWHDDKDDCACRKPKPGLVLDLAAAHGIDVGLSWMIGDRWRDVSCAKAAGCGAIFIDYGYLETYKGPPPDVTVRSLGEAVDAILSRI
jgi:D-glycero-D-manno-heptose 1,7-bisphosphate phosphatase